jgi:hypothetical protein
MENYDAWLLAATTRSAFHLYDAAFHYAKENPVIAAKLH